MRFIIYFFCLFFLISLNVSAKITKKDYFSIFSKYQVTEKKKVQQVVNDCINKFGREKLKIIKTNDGDILEHKNEKEFLDCTYSKILNIIKPKPIPGLNSNPKKKK